MAGAGVFTRGEFNQKLERIMKTEVRRLPVVVLDDVAHRPDGCQVFVVAFGVDVVEGLGRAGVAVGAGEIDGDLMHQRRGLRRGRGSSIYDFYFGKSYIYCP